MTFSIAGENIVMMTVITIEMTAVMMTMMLLITITIM